MHKLRQHQAGNSNFSTENQEIGILPGSTRSKAANSETANEPVHRDFSQTKKGSLVSNYSSCGSSSKFSESLFTESSKIPIEAHSIDENASNGMEYECSSSSESIHALDDEFHYNIASSKSMVQKEELLRKESDNSLWNSKTDQLEKIASFDQFISSQSMGHVQEISVNSNCKNSSGIQYHTNGNVLITQGSEKNDDTGIKKVAPRSNNLFRVGPPFFPTNLHCKLFCIETSEQLLPIMSSRIDRGFELGEAGHWIGYKRNYVTLVSTFTFHGWSLGRFLKHHYFVLDEDNCKVEVKSFAFAISVKCNSPDVKVGLVQHTPKRDKGPKYATPIYPAVPGGELPEHHTVQRSSNKRNQTRVANMQKIFNFDREIYYKEHKLDLGSDHTILKNYPGDLLTKVARFERIQFTKSLRVETENVPNKFFTLSVELLGILDEDIEKPHKVVLATSDTVPLLVRGRSASMYPSEKTSGYRETNSD